jgi:uncharacterized protein YbaR (Trm112 family)
MAICPHCKRHIETLTYTAVESVIETFTSDAEYKPDELVDINNPEYSCPFCKYPLFFNQEEAYEFLNKEEVE